MRDYIEREAVLNLARSGQLIANCNFRKVCQLIADIPAADVRPVNRGTWEETEMSGWDGDTAWVCSSCGEPWVLIDGTPSENNMNFCPNCGADNRKEADA